MLRLVKRLKVLKINFVVNFIELLRMLCFRIGVGVVVGDQQITSLLP